MMIDYLVLAPLDIEREALLDQLQSTGTEMRLDQGRDEHHVTLGDGRRIVIKSLGRAGRVTAAMATQEALTRLEPRAMLVVGIAGGVDERIALGDILVADQVVDASHRLAGQGGDQVQSQVYRMSPRLRSIAKRLGPAWIGQITTQRPGHVPSAPSVHFGILVSTDTVVSTLDYLTPLRDSFRGLLGVEQESGGVVQAIETLAQRTELLVIRCIVDHLGVSKHDDWRAHGAHTAAAFAVALIQADHDRAAGVVSDEPGRSSDPPRDPSATPVVDDGPGQAGSGTNLIRDVRGKEPVLHADEYAGALADVLARASGEICFALLGHWGRGKTYFAKLVGDKLPDTYDHIWFSAWKYRNRPELWAHLHESFYHKLMQVAWWRRVPRVFRANLHKHGIGPLLMMLVGAGIAAIPIGSLLRVVLVALGLIGAIRGIILYFKQRTPIATTLNRFLNINRHTEKLGFQAAIGSDLESMVIGWAGGQRWDTKKRSLGIIGYVLGVSVFIGGLWMGFHPREMPEFLRVEWPESLKWLEWYPSPGVWQTILCAVVVLALGLPVWLLGAGRGKDRLLLIVDDLDRMPSGEMLEVVESLKLFLENDEVLKIVQLLMICEEGSLRTALENKYGGATRSTEENLQKLFIAHLRLPPLSPDEQKDILTHIIGELNDPESSATGAANNASGVTRAPSTPATQPEPARPPKEPVQTSAVAKAPAVEFTDDDRRALQKGLRILSAADGTWATLGPRAIQSYVLRYKLARRLLESRSNQVPPERLARLLAERMHTGSEIAAAQAPAGDGSVIDEVIAAVV